MVESDLKLIAREGQRGCQRQENFILRDRRGWYAQTVLMESHISHVSLRPSSGVQDCWECLAGSYSGIRTEICTLELLEVLARAALTARAYDPT